MKETIVLIHGYGFDNRIWSSLEIAFDAFEVVYLSLPGFSNEVVEEPYSINVLAQQYWLALEPLKGTRVHLVGHSMGGYVCMEMVAQQSSRVASVALIHSHVYADTTEKKLHRSTAMEGIKNNGRSQLVHQMIPSLFGDKEDMSLVINALIHRGMKYNDHAWYFGMQAIRDRNDHADTMKNLRVPVLMIMGEKDMAVPVDLAYKQASLAEQNTLCVFPDVGHMVMYENSPAALVAMTRFYEYLQA